MVKLHGETITEEVAIEDESHRRMEDGVAKLIYTQTTNEVPTKLRDQPFRRVLGWVDNTHTGTMAVEVMGHNFVLLKQEQLSGLHYRSK
jgi:erythromycin esterase-like protein